MSWYPESPFEKFVYYHGRTKAYLNTPKTLPDGNVNYLTSDCATLIGCYLNVSRLVEDMSIDINLYHEFLLVAAKEISENRGIPIQDVYRNLNRQCLEKHY